MIFNSFLSNTAPTVRTFSFKAEHRQTELHEVVLECNTWLRALYFFPPLNTASFNSCTCCHFAPNCKKVYLPEGSWTQRKLSRLRVSWRHVSAHLNERRRIFTSLCSASKNLCFSLHVSTADGTTETSLDGARVFIYTRSEEMRIFLFSLVWHGFTDCSGVTLSCLSHLWCRILHVTSASCEIYLL